MTFHFLEEGTRVFGPAFVKSLMHRLQHLCALVWRHGPLPCSWMFAGERVMGVMKELNVNGRYSCASVTSGRLA